MNRKDSRKEEGVRMFDLMALLDINHFVHMVNTYVSNDWSIDNLLKNGNNNAKKWGGLFFGLLGTACFLWGGIQGAGIVFSKQGKGKFAWVALLGIVIGGLLAYGGLSTFTEMSQGGFKSVEKLGK